MESVKHGSMNGKLTCCPTSVGHHGFGLKEMKRSNYRQFRL
jgi:hypothetical protein